MSMYSQVTAEECSEPHDTRAHAYGLLPVQMRLSVLDVSYILIHIFVYMHVFSATSHDWEDMPNVQAQYKTCLALTSAFFVFRNGACILKHCFAWLRRRFCKLERCVEGFKRHCALNRRRWFSHKQCIWLKALLTSHTYFTLLLELVQHVLLSCWQLSTHVQHYWTCAQTFVVATTCCRTCKIRQLWPAF